MDKDVTNRSRIGCYYGGKTIKYVLLGRGVSQGDSLSAFLFIKTKPEIAGLTIFDRATFTLYMLIKRFS